MAKLNILVVDDDKLFLDTIGDWIKSWGHTTAAASSGQEAIDAVKNNKFDVIILDYIMPEMDGVAALKEIRKIDSKVAVIMFTGYPDERSVSEGCKLGISSYIPKLNDVVNVHSVLEAALDLIEKKLSQ